MMVRESMTGESETHVERPPRTGLTLTLRQTFR
jgi:hypothetical protein